MIEQRLLEITGYEGEGYRPLIDYDSWRVAVLNYCEELLPDRISKMQRHDETDEVFVLLRGECLLFIGDGDERVTRILPQKLEPFKLYNVKHSVWHTHTLSRDAQVLIVENRETGPGNSPEIDLDPGQRRELVRLAREFQLPDGV